jgi:hypothetical protein
MSSSPCLVHKNILGIGPGLGIMLDANFYEKALFVKVDVATALW